MRATVCWGSIRNRDCILYPGRGYGCSNSACTDFYERINLGERKDEGAGQAYAMDKIELLVILLRRDDRLDEQRVRESIQQLDGVRLVDAERFAISDAFVFAARRWGKRRVKLLRQMYKNIEKRSPEPTRRRRRRSKA